MESIARTTRIPLARQSLGRGRTRLRVEERGSTLKVRARRIHFWRSEERSLYSRTVLSNLWVDVSVSADQQIRPLSTRDNGRLKERETRLELATSSLGSNLGNAEKTPFLPENNRILRPQRQFASPCKNLEICACCGRNRGRKGVNTPLAFVVLQWPAETVAASAARTAEQGCHSLPSNRRLQPWS